MEFLAGRGFDLSGLLAAGSLRNLRGALCDDGVDDAHDDLTIGAAEVIGGAEAGEEFAVADLCGGDGALVVFDAEQEPAHGDVEDADDPDEDGAGGKSPALFVAVDGADLRIDGFGEVGQGESALVAELPEALAERFAKCSLIVHG
jgi:hypothetical protein